MSHNICLSEHDIKNGRNYFFRKSSEEVIKFNKKKSYEHISHQKDGILWYTGRILPTSKVTITGKFTTVMKDLSESSFCVPIIDKYSPVAYSLVHEVHWYDDVAKHSGIESTWRTVLKNAFIIEGRDIVKKFRKGCERC